MPVGFITGGTSGIGFAIAKKLREEGYSVYITGRREDFPEFNYIKADVRKFEEIKSAVKRVVDESGEIDVLVVNAGIARVGYVENMDIGDWEDVISTNLNGAFYTVKAALKHIKDGGNIIFIGSVASKEAFPGWSAYCASKFGLLGFALSLAEELKGRIKVSIVLSGAVDTNIWNDLGYTYPRDRMLKAEDIADVVIGILRNKGWIKEVVILPTGGII